MKSVEQDVIDVLEDTETKDISTIKVLCEASKLFDDMVKAGVATKRGNTLASESTMPDSYIAFNE